MWNEEALQKEHVKILIVDDDFIIRQFMETVLLSRGYLCVCAEDGLAATELLKKDSFDMVISDVEMPRLNGLELFSYVKYNYPEIKIILISGEYKPNDETDCPFIKDAPCFLAKPFPITLLLSTVNSVLNLP